IYTSCHFLFFLTSFVSLPVILLKSRRPPSSTPFPCTTLFRSSPTPDPSTGERPRTPRTAHAAQPPPAPSRTPATTPRPAAASTTPEHWTTRARHCPTPTTTRPPSPHGHAGDDSLGPPEEAPAFRSGRNPAPGRGGPAKPGQPKARSAQDLLLSLTDQAKE